MNGFTLGVVLMFCTMYTSAGMENSRVVKRQSDKAVLYTVELLIVADFTVYNYWIEKVEGEKNTTLNKDEEAERRLYRYYETTVRGMNLRFSSLNSTQFAIDITVSDVIIIKTREETGWLDSYGSGQTLDAVQTLSSLRTWRQTTKELPSHDHVMLFTMYDLVKDGSESIAGMAYTGSMCTSTSLSIVEDTLSSQTCTVATHELAHSIGSRHDGKINRCSNQDNYIMSETTNVSGDLRKNRNTWIFSECSVEYIAEYIGKLNERRVKCLINMADQRISTSFSDVTRDMPATAPSPDYQCERIQGDNSYLCRSHYKDGDYSDFCALMYCSVDGELCQTHLPLDGTTCGHNKVCSAGYCVDHSAVASNTSDGYSEKCPFGDQPGLLKDTNQGCQATVDQASHLCYQDYYVSRCCHSCAQRSTNIEGCEYGDKEEKCKSISNFECIFWKEDCCAACDNYMEKLQEWIVPVGAGGGAIILLLVLTVIIRKQMCRPKKSARPGNNRSRPRNAKPQDSRAVEDNSRSGYANPAFQENNLPSVHGFRVPGSRHEPMFQYDRQAKLLLSTMLENNSGSNPWSQRPESLLSESRSAFPGSDVMGQTLPAWQQFNLRAFGGGCRPLPSIEDKNS